MRLLVVEDNPLDIRLLEYTLDKGGAEVELDTCADGDEALAWLTDGPGAGGRRPELIFLDLRMPRMGGFELLEAMGGTEQPVYILSSSTHEADLERARELGVAGFIGKPADLAGYLGLVRALIDGELDSLSLLPPS